ncbi:fungal trichothecene efflux pump [Lineolata rhizophorae]|uniref:Fungal trichothecene efflux pump n=1 Tax=Lineolata rhizophorae TaxID=578093 RepID=A0A6A6NQT7_9PEZI|nr:fungal trichothecene efflux pump [Lineolata rhizophorae]
MGTPGLSEPGAKPVAEKHEHREDAAPLDIDDPHRAALEDNPEHPEKLTTSTILAVVSMGLSFMSAISLGFMLPSAILVQIGTDLGDAEQGHIAWILGSWSVASSVSFSIAGKVSDVFGRRWVMIIGEILVLIGSIIAATANTTLVVVGGSTIIGFGTGIIFVSYAGISELLPNKWRGAGLGFTEFCMTIPWNSCGVLIAALLAARTGEGWRWCYYLGIICNVPSTLGTYFFYFPPTRPQRDYDKTRWQEIKELDYIGCFLYTGGVTIFLIGLTWAGSEGHPWKSASVIAPIVIGVLTIVACFVYDFTLAKDPFFPFSLMRRLRDFTMLLVIVFVAGMIFYSMAGLLPQATMYLFDNDPVQIGIISLPNGFGQFFFGAVMTQFFGKIGHLRLQIIICIALQTIFVAAYAGVIPNNKSAWMAFQFFGMGPFALITLACYVVAGLNVPLRHLGLASGLIGTFRSGGGAVGNAIFNTILQSVSKTEVPSRITAAALALGYEAENLPALIGAAQENAVGVPGAFAEVPGITPALQAAAIEATRQGWAQAFKMVFYSTIPFGVIALACGCCISDPSKYLTNHTAVHMEHEGFAGHGHGKHHHHHEKKVTAEKAADGNGSGSEA